MTDEPPEDLSKQDLWNRLRRLEQEVFPDRREILRKGAAAASLGAAGMIGRASAAPGDDGETTWGSANNRDSWYADEIDANSVSTDSADIGANASSIGSLTSIGSSDITAGPTVTLADDAKEVIKDFQPPKMGLLLIQNDSDADHAIFATLSTSISTIESRGPWATSDSDSNNCVFFDGNSDLVVKNRTGASKDFDLIHIGIN